MSIFLKIFISISITTIISISFFVNYIINIKENEAQERLNNKIEYHKRINETTISQLLFDLNKEILTTNLTSLYLDNDIAKIELNDYSRVINLVFDSKELKNDLLKSNIILAVDDEILGELNIFYTKNDINKSIDTYKESVIELSIFLVILLLAIIYYFINKSIKSIKELTLASKEIASGNLDFKIDIKSNDELGILANKFDVMRNTLKSRIDTINEQLSFQHSLMQSVNIPIYIKDEKGIYIDCNDAFANFYGKNKDNLIGKDMTYLVNGGHLKIQAKLDKELFEKGTSITLETKLPDSNMNLRDIVLFKNLYTNKKKNQKLIIGTYFDITEINKAKEKIEKFNEELQQKVYERTEELEESNEELQITISNLEQTQDKLVESEKLASLGSLVAGVAHEINTPVGIGLTGITHLLEEVETITKKYEDEEMTEEAFSEFLKSSHDISLLINTNLQRTAQLVKSFKQISVDQTSEAKREFKLNEYIDDILFSLTNVTKKAHVKINFFHDADTLINSYPGELSQIITNLVVNSVNHAFEGIENKTINIQTIFENDKVNIIYEDNGKGIKEENLDKIFDPFFTTNRQQGNTGLGLNVIYNIITKTFNGSIKCESSEGKGVKFVILLRV